MLRLLAVFCVASLCACGPRQFVKVHFASFADTNQGRAVPVYVIPLDDAMKRKLETMSAEDIILSEDLENMVNLYKLPLSGVDQGELVLERKNNRNDFLVVVDYADIISSVNQKKNMDKQFYRSKELYVLLQKDRLQVVSKASFHDHVKNAKQFHKDVNSTIDAFKDLKN